MSAVKNKRHTGRLLQSQARAPLAEICYTYSYWVIGIIACFCRFVNRFEQKNSRLELKVC